jgi:hypothetical protein
MRVHEDAQMHNEFPLTMSLFMNNKKTGIYPIIQRCHRIHIVIEIPG